MQQQWLLYRLYCTVYHAVYYTVSSTVYYAVYSTVYSTVYLAVYSTVLVMLQNGSLFQSVKYKNNLNF